MGHWVESWERPNSNNGGKTRARSSKRCHSFGSEQDIHHTSSYTISKPLEVTVKEREEDSTRGVLTVYGALKVEMPLILWMQTHQFKSLLLLSLRWVAMTHYQREHVLTHITRFPLSSNGCFGVWYEDERRGDDEWLVRVHETGFDVSHVTLHREAYYHVRLDAFPAVHRIAHSRR